MSKLKNKINLTADHWDVINIINQFYLTYNIHPTIRKLISELAKIWPPEKANSIYLHKLFPKNIIQSACEFGNIPKPPLKCI